MNWEVRHGERRKSGEIEALREQVAFWKADSAAAWDKCEERRLEAAAMTQERDTLNAALDAKITICGDANLAAAQARIKELREALETISDEENWGEDGCWESSSYPDEIAMEALATPDDPTCLEARLAAERDRIAVLLDEASGKGDIVSCLSAARFIRSMK